MFTYLGYSVLGLKAIDWGLTISMFLLVCVARAVSLFIWVLVRWIFKRKGGVGWKEVGMVWYGGCIKGKIILLP